MTIELFSISEIKDSLTNQDEDDVIHMVKYWLYREYHKDLSIYSLLPQHYQSYSLLRTFLVNTMFGKFTLPSSEVTDVVYLPNTNGQDLRITSFQGM